MSITELIIRIRLTFSLKKKGVNNFLISKKSHIKPGLRAYIGKRCKGLIINDHVKINRNVDLEVGGSLKIDERAVIGVGCFIQADGDVIIGSGTLMGPGSKIFSTTHEYGRKSEIHNPLIKGRVVIGKNVWIGSGAIISINVEIGDNSVIGANSFVNKSIPENCVAVGAPAKIIKRF